MKFFRFNTNCSLFSSCAFSSQGDSIIAGKENGDLFFIERKEGTVSSKNFSLHRSEIVKLISYNNLLLTASKDSTGILWDKEKEQKIRIFGSHKGPINDLDLKENKILTAGQDGVVKIWDKRIAREIENFHHGFNLKSAKFLPLNDSVISCGLSTQIFLWDLKVNNEKSFYPYLLRGHTNCLTSLSFSPEKIYFFSLDIDQNINKWFFRKICPFFRNKTLGIGNKFRQKNGEYSEYKISCDFKGDFFSLTGGEEECFLFFQTTGKLYKKFSDHLGFIKQICFHPKKRFLGSCGQDGSLVIRSF